MIQRGYLLRAGKLSLAVALLGGAVAAVAAQDSVNEGAADDNVIVVTAQKRSEDVQDVPISMAVFSADSLEDANVDNILELTTVAPNFQARQSQQIATTTLRVRGIGAAGNTAIEPSVATFLDGVYIPRSGSVIASFLDIEGVELLRGPQGTLFGRNASAGALSLRTGTPRNEFSGLVRGEVANGDRYKIDGYINAPLGENVSVRAAGLYQDFGGYWFNRLDGEQLGGSETAAGRISLNAQFGALDWTVRADYSKITGDGLSNNDFDPSSVTPAQLAFFQARLGGVLPDTNLFDRTLNQFQESRFTDEHWGIMSDASLDVGDFTFRLINSYRDWDNFQNDGDISFTPRNIFTRDGAYRSKSHNHELQIISPERGLLDGALDFVAGLYYFQEDYRIDEQFQLGPDFCTTLVPPPARPQCSGLLAMGRGANATDLDFFQDVESIAAYAQANVYASDALWFTLGGRWTRDEKDALFDQRVNNPFAGNIRAPELQPLALTEKRFTYRVGINYQPNDDLLLFASHSTGYKSGGFNSGGSGTPLLGRRTFARETIDNYEIGMKSTWLDGALQANLTLYRMDVNGLQDRTFDGIGFIVLNAGDLRQQGFEFDTIIRPSDRFKLTASLAYLDSKFTDFPLASGLPGIGGTQDLTGQNVAVGSPEFTGAVGFQWDGEFGNSDIGWRLNSNLSFQSDVFAGASTDGNPQSIQDGFALLDARFTIESLNDSWSLSVFGSNLFDKGYCTVRFPQPLGAAFGLNNGVFPGSTGIRCTEATPRTYGVTGTFKF
jgi:iron complex outermembrane recepter protein